MGTAEWMNFVGLIGGGLVGGLISFAVARASVAARLVAMAPTRREELLTRQEEGLRRDLTNEVVRLQRNQEGLLQRVSALEMSLRKSLEENVLLRGEIAVLKRENEALKLRVAELECRPNGGAMTVCVPVTTHDGEKA